MIYIVAGARPNFMKIAPLIKRMKKEDISFILVHTGQHYDFIMSDIFFEDLEIPKHDIHLNVGSHSHTMQTAMIMIKFEKYLLRDKPELVIVVGDVNSTLACALTAKKLGIKIANIEAGLRSFDMNMPEEVNRILTDHVSDYLFVSERSGMINLKKEGIDFSKVFFVGNIMIENLINNLNKIKRTPSKDKYVLITFHRPSNIDKKEDLEKIIDMMIDINGIIKVLFVAHPRTIKNIHKYDLDDKLKENNITIMNAVGYLQFLQLMIDSTLIITDSDGIQEEASFLKIPVLTVRKTTERPITIQKGTNTLIKTVNSIDIMIYINKILMGNYKKGEIIDKWDNLVSERIIKYLKYNKDLNN